MTTNSTPPGTDYDVGNDSAHQTGGGQSLPIVVTLLAVGFALRAPNLGSSGLWLDECTTAYRVANLHTVFTQNDGTSWFYPLLVWLSTSLFGESEVALRLPSLLAGTLLGPTIYWFLSHRQSKHLAVFGGLLGVFNPMSLHYSQEARVYSLAMLLAVIWFFLLSELLYPRDGNVNSSLLPVGFIIVSPLLALCHMYALFLGGAGLIIAIFRLYQRPDLRARSLKTILAAYSVTLAIWIPSILVTVSTFARKQVDSQVNPYSPHHSLNSIVENYFGTMLSSYNGYHWLNIISVAVGAAALGLALLLPSRRHDWSWGAGYLFCLLLVTSTEQFIPTYVRGRYDTVFIGLAIVCVVLAVKHIHGSQQRNIAMGLVLASQLSGCWFFLTLSTPKSASKEQAHFISSANADLVVLTLPRGFHPMYTMPLSYYLHQKMDLPTPILEIPTFKALSDEWNSPTEYYLQYEALLSVPLEEKLKKLDQEIRQHRIVAVVGQPPELQELRPVLNRYKQLGRATFSGLNEGASLILLIENSRPSRNTN